ncbi:hypothetical protein ACFX2H_032176 [Malus domestica]
MRNLLCGNYGQLCQKAPKAHPLSTSSSPRMHSQRTLSSHSVFLIPWDTPANNPSRAKVFHIIMVESKRHGEIALEYSSSTADVLPKKLPHLPEEQIRQAKMIPTACGDNVQKGMCKRETWTTNKFVKTACAD